MAITQNSFPPETVMVAALVQKVEIEILLSLSEALAAQHGTEKVGGLSIREWFQQQKASRVEEMQKQFQTTDPAVAEKLQSILEECRKPIGEDGKGR